ncbi:HET-domain-containing protein [Ophiobolus disseminans]|uniref:HET-domain-containing protein n=1 Tax=Ophiobolus disseminans TaxID=1469910 RepID=A0A6A7AH36_9PLEO|nr:HET-domain-containing protein [Ophiobolus disseminans]
MEESKLQGICWECRGFKFAPREEKSLSQSDHEFHYEVKRSSICSDCELCLRLKSLFRRIPSDENKGAAYPPHYSTLRVMEHALQPQPLVLQLSNSTKVLQEVLLVPIIDCSRRQLCTLPHGTPYICLSYVWGTPSDSGQSSLDLPWYFLKTIEDSICVALQLDIFHLWVDCYCIDQNDSVEKHRLIQNMDAIYHNATVTIISTSGDGPHSGLPGINGTFRPQQQAFTVGVLGLNFQALNYPQPEISNSALNTRAWTFQELLLSRRQLVFTDSQVYFQCAGMHCVEASETPPAMKHTSSRHVDTIFEVLRSHVKGFTHLDFGYKTDSLYTSLQEYFQKRLSFSDDTISASIGIVNAFVIPPETSEAGSEGEIIRATQFYGLPLFFSSSLSSQEISPTNSFASSLAW